VKTIGNVFIMTFLFNFIFAVIGVQSFQGCFARCNGMYATYLSGEGIDACNGENVSELMPSALPITVSEASQNVCLSLYVYNHLTVLRLSWNADGSDVNRVDCVGLFNATDSNDTIVAEPRVVREIGNLFEEAL
jgi:hypothetical protein